MKGTVVNIWITTLRRMVGAPGVSSAMRKVSWNEERIISPMEDVKDPEIFALVEAIAAEAKKIPPTSGVKSAATTSSPSRTGSPAISSTPTTRAS